MAVAKRNPASAGDDRGKPLVSLLMDDGTLGTASALGALAEAGRLDRPMAEVIAAEALVDPERLLDALARRHGAQLLRSAEHAPDPSCVTLLPARFCLEHAVLPWRRIGDALLLATARPGSFDQIPLPEGIGPVIMAVTSEQDIHDTLGTLSGQALVQAAETQRRAADSCRDMGSPGLTTGLIGLGLAILGGALLALEPGLFFGAALGLACLSLLVSQGLKLTALMATVLHQQPPDDGPASIPHRLPRISLLVPLLREADIAGTLLKRLDQLDYPHSLLEAALILEAGDDQTRRALAQTRLPPWCKVITVPKGSIQTKPRALNYALPFTRGDIIGVYDAEDAPATDQLMRVVAHFARVPPLVACLQGVLDFYNPRANWLSRCFAIEYASWFRTLLPGMVRLGLPIPLGGTTVFFRRPALEAAQGWDAHNVTEDADLGIHLARLGYRTELLDSATREEANNRLWPLIRQRSRWLKGYAMTWWVHSRRPIRLWRDLGTRKFLGMQALFLGTLAQFTLAPVLWSFWLIVFGLPHPLDGLLGADRQRILVVLFLTAEAVSLLVGITALSRSPHRGMMHWVPTLFLYFPLGTFAIYKALWEMVTRPFYWDKTEHGRSVPDTGSPP